MTRRGTDRAIDEQLASAFPPDRPQLRRRLRRAGRSREAADAIASDIRESAARWTRRRERLPALTWPVLPIVERREEIAAAIREHPVVIVCGETGSGKSTQLPKICLDAGRGVDGVIGQTQPRRIAARSVATRIANEIGTELGDLVGSKVRFRDRSSRDGFIKIMTDGILLAETQHDRRLEQYDTIIIDEAHERSLNIDFLLGYLTQLVRRRSDLRIIVTSATLDPERLSAHFADAPVIEVEGRTYPVEVRYRELSGSGEDRDLLRGVVEGVDELIDPENGCGGDVLVFLSGEREIRAAHKALRSHERRGLEILPLYSRLSEADQDRVFKPHKGTRVVLATNVAETSLTVPGIHGVIDGGQARIARYSARTGVQRLPVESISQASAAQRSGRCGRIAPGVCIRLFSESDFSKREEFTAPEILRTDLASVILRMTDLRLGDVRTYPFVDPPRRPMVRDGYETLYELGALDERDQLTDLGRRLARIPVDPRVGRMLLAAEEGNCLREMLIIASALEIQDPRERPHDRAEEADRAHAAFRVDGSDFLGWIELWNFWRKQRNELSWNRLRRLCASSFLSFPRMREWEELHGQLRASMQEVGAKLNRERASEDAIHKALLPGLLSRIGRVEERGEYEGAGGRRFRIFPGSVLFNSSPKWVMASEIVETTRCWGRGCARIRPEWIEKAGAHLLSRRHVDPGWDAEHGRAVVIEQVSLFGLEVARRRRALSNIDAAEARSLLIAHGLVEGDMVYADHFIKHNRALIAEIEAEEAKRRRRDLLVDHVARFSFYDERIPKDIVDRASLQRWYRKAKRRDEGILCMTREDLVRADARFADGDRFPDHLEVGGARLPLRYRLEPGHEDDGVTLDIPVEMLGALPAERLGWLVPGLIEEKVTALLRGLPKATRRDLGPAPQCAAVLLERLTFAHGELTSELSSAIAAEFGVLIEPAAWDEAGLPAHLRMNLRIVGDEDEVVGAGRDLVELRRTHGSSARSRVATLATDSWGAENVLQWNFGAIPESIDMSVGDATFSTHPVVEDRDGTVVLSVVEDRASATEMTRQGVRRLYTLVMGKELTAQLGRVHDVDRLRLLARSLGEAVDLDGALRLRTAERAFMPDGKVPRDEAAFREQRKAGGAMLWEVGGQVATLFGTILQAHHDARIEIAVVEPVFDDIAAEIAGQLDRLIAEDFLVETPWGWLHQVPRYITGMQRRLERAAKPKGLERDAKLSAQIAPRDAALAERAADLAGRGLFDRALVDYRWMLEEWRVNLFAQDLGTAVPVSEKRLDAQWAKVRA